MSTYLYDLPSPITTELPISRELVTPPIILDKYTQS
jgi:hypothetical protein